VRQAIALLLDRGVAPQSILYFSFDDPALFASPELQREIFDDLVGLFKGRQQPLYFFLDEIQRLPRWELFIKKYYDLKTPIRFVISGSASSPIFRSSQESLLGRIKDRHLLPFSFREYCEHKLQATPEFAEILALQGGLREALLQEDGPGCAEAARKLDEALRQFDRAVNDAVCSYCLEGGFPEVWTLNDPVRKIEYLMEQQVRKVLYEDLMTLTKYRKPENVLRFFLFLLAHPGIEINTAKVSQETGIERRVIDENLPRLEMTDMIVRIQRFSHQPHRVRQGNFKCYPIDMALRNAVLRQWTLPDQTTMGYLAENMVLRQLSTWPEKIEITYYREKKEVDFVLTHGGNKHLPLEVKHRERVAQQTILRRFLKKFGGKLGVIITRQKESRCEGEILELPLRYFLLGCGRA
jgi:predicted AAA+ superfamily ATPase